MRIGPDVWANMGMLADWVGKALPWRYFSGFGPCFLKSLVNLR